MTRRPWPRSVRTRLALWHGVALLVVVTIYGAASWWQMRDDLHEELQRSTAMLAESAGGPGSALAAARAVRAESEVQHELGEFALALTASLPFAFLAACGAGYLLARRALAPVAAMTARAREITADRLQDRLPVANPHDELGQLATVVNDALARLERSFTTLRQFTADASHELRTPLAAIRTVGEVGLRTDHDANGYRELIGSMLEESDRLAAVVDSLLVISRADSGRLEVQARRVDLAEIARGVVETFQLLAEEKRQEIGFSARGEAHVVADPGLLRQALVNIVDNAIKFCPEGAVIRVRVGEEGREAVAEVADSGPGIPAEHLPRVFERFYRVDPARGREAGGSGLGLAIARHAVEANHGRIEADSPSTGGAVFRIVLPGTGGAS